MDTDPKTPSPARRDFLKTSTSVAVGAGIAFPNIASAATPAGTPNGSRLKVGLVGAGGRGTGAAGQALAADSNVELTAIAEVSEKQARNALNTLAGRKKDQVKVDDGKIFIGLDGYKKVIESGVDVVILTTPPGFRPIMLKAAIDAGKHVFCEKPVAVDAPGIRSVLQSAQDAASKKLSIVCGFCWRYHYERRALFERIHDGAIGDVTNMFATYYTGPVKPMPAASRRPKQMTDVAWQVKNWYNFSWLSGDSLVEQAVHSVDKIAWAMKDEPPIAAVATGGRQIPAEGGNIFDHFHVAYEYPNNVRCHLGSRQQRGTHGENNDYINGTKGNAIIAGGQCIIRGEENWRYEGAKNDMYQEEHDTLFSAIRSGKTVNDGQWMANSTMLAILGRMAAYTGAKITWDEAMKSTEDLAPDDLTWESDFDPGPVPKPGITKFT